MRKVLAVPLFACVLLASACSPAVSSSASKASSVATSAGVSSVETSVSSSSSTSSSSAESSTIASMFGAFSLTQKSTDGSAPVYDAATNTYTLAVAATKAVYVASGYFSGSIVVANPNSLSSYKGCEIILTGAYIENKESGGSAIVDTLSKKYVEVYSEASTENYIVADGVAIKSENNLRVGSVSSIHIISKSSHGLQGADICLYGSGNIDISAAADGIHGENLYTNNTESNSDLVPLTGTVTIRDAQEQALDFCDGSGTTADPWVGQISIDEGASFLISGGKNVARVNLGMSVAGSLVATNISEDALLTKNTGACPITVSGTFTVNGTAIPSETI